MKTTILYEGDSTRAATIALFDNVKELQAVTRMLVQSDLEQRWWEGLTDDPCPGISARVDHTSRRCQSFCRTLGIPAVSYALKWSEPFSRIKLIRNEPS